MRKELNLIRQYSKIEFNTFLEGYVNEDGDLIFYLPLPDHAKHTSIVSFLPMQLPLQQQMLFTLK